MESRLQDWCVGGLQGSALRARGGGGLKPQWKPHGKYELPVENFFFNAKENHTCEQIRQLLTPSKTEVIP